MPLDSFKMTVKLNAIPGSHAVRIVRVAVRLALCSILASVLGLAGCGIQSQPRSGLASPEAAIRFIAIRTEPASGTESRRTLPRAVAPTGAADRGLSNACVVLLVESPSFRYADEKIVCEELSPPSDIAPQGSSSQGSANLSANLTAEQAELFRPAGVILSVTKPSQLDDAAVQRLSQGVQ